MTAYDIKDFEFRLLGYDRETETVEYSYSVDSEIESVIEVTEHTLSIPEDYMISIETNNETEQALVGNVYVTAEIHDKNDYQVVLREYTATINLTIQSSEPTPTGGIQPTTVTTTMEGEDSKDIEYTLLPDTYDISTEDVIYDYELTGSSDFTSKIELSDNFDPETGIYVLTINTANYTENTVTGTINVNAKIHDLHSSQLLRTYTATINLTIEPI